MRHSGGTLPAASYAWLFDLLYGRPAADSQSRLVTWAPAGRLPSRFRRSEQFAVLPGGRDRAFMVSLASRRGSAAALTSYGRLRPPSRRLGRLAVGLALRSGTAGPFLGTTIDIGTAADATARQLGEALITEHLAGLLGRPKVVMAFGGGSGPYRKPVLQVFGTDGAPLGYVKVGWNPWTRDAVRREAAALRAITAGDRHGRLAAPELLHHGQWHDLELIVTAPLPAGVRRPGPELPAAGSLREICQLSAVTVGALAESSWWSEIRTRIATGVTDPASRARLELAADRLSTAHGHVRLEFGCWHGDLVPWNLARLGSRLYAWDWESSAPSAPVGLDALHFGFQVAFVAGRVPLAQAVARAAGEARGALADLAVPAEAHALLSELHLLELCVRHEEARASTGDADDRFFPAAMRMLDRPVPVQPAPGPRVQDRVA